MSGKAEQKSFTTPDETRSFDYGALDLLQIGGAEIGRLTLQPGWRWSDHVKPLAGTELCQAPHFQYHVAGTLHVVMADGAEFDARPGDVTALPEGTTPGWSGTSRSWWWTGTAPATTPAAKPSPGCSASAMW
jgi:quercetin dioxygenase-like cupin family protein